jgi:hypothetical protein
MVAVEFDMSFVAVELIAALPSVSGDSVSGIRRFITAFNQHVE